RPAVGGRVGGGGMEKEVGKGMAGRWLYTATAPDSAAGPMARVVSTNRFIEDAADLLDLCAPDSLAEGRRGGHAAGAAAVEFAYRLSTATNIYGGAAEIIKRIVAPAALGVARSPSLPTSAPVRILDAVEPRHRLRDERGEGQREVRLAREREHVREILLGDRHVVAHQRLHRLGLAHRLRQLDPAEIVDHQRRQLTV